MYLLSYLIMHDEHNLYFVLIFKSVLHMAVFSSLSIPSLPLIWNPIPWPAYIAFSTANSQLCFHSNNEHGQWTSPQNSQTSSLNHLPTL